MTLSETPQADSGNLRRTHAYSTEKAAKTAASRRHGLHGVVIARSKSPNLYGWHEYLWFPTEKLVPSGWRVVSRHTAQGWQEI